jgi:hypothetical protein
MRKVLSLFAVVVFSSAVLTGQEVRPAPSRAVEIWERAVTAKGGRERLRGISNFLVEQRIPGKQQPPRYVDLNIFPDKFWRWSDDGGVIGTNLSVGDSVNSWKAYRYGGGQGVNWYPPENRTHREYWAQAMFLMEGPLYIPKILDLKTERIGREDFDVVTVDAVRDRVKYFIDRRTYLVRRVSPEGRYGDVVTILWNFTGYVARDGIMMPSRMSSPDGATIDLEFGFNVTYDPNLFTRKPALEDGPEGWKPSK